MDSGPWPHGGTLLRGAQSPWGATAAGAARLSDGSHVGSRVGVPLHHSAAVSSGSGRRAAATSAQHGPEEVRGFPPVAPGLQRGRPINGESVNASLFAYIRKIPKRSLHFQTMIYTYSLKVCKSLGDDEI